MFKIFAPVIDDVIEPLIRRAGTALGSALLAYGVSTHEVDTIVAGAVALVGVIIDLSLDRRRIRKIAVEKINETLQEKS